MFFFRHFGEYIHLNWLRLSWPASMFKLSSGLRDHGTTRRYIYIYMCVCVCARVCVCVCVCVCVYLIMAHVSHLHSPTLWVSYIIRISLFSRYNLWGEMVHEQTPGFCDWDPTWAERSRYHSIDCSDGRAYVTYELILLILLCNKLKCILKSKIWIARRITSSTNVKR